MEQANFLVLIKSSNYAKAVRVCALSICSKNLLNYKPTDTTKLRTVTFFTRSLSKERQKR